MIAQFESIKSARHRLAERYGHRIGDIRIGKMVDIEGGEWADE